jgi:hypothetical protein
MEDVRDDFDWAGIAASTEGVYRRVLAEFTESAWSAESTGEVLAAEPGRPALGHFPERLSAYLPTGWSVPVAPEVVSTP